MRGVQFKCGDLAQATVRILDEIYEGEPPVEVCVPGDLVHVLGEKSPLYGWPTVFVERTGCVTVISPEELIWLGDADTGKDTAKLIKSTHEATHVGIV